MDGLEAEYQGKVEFRRLNVDEAENGRLQQSYGLRGHPSVVILDGRGEVAELYFGPESAETLGTVLNNMTD